MHELCACYSVCVLFYLALSDQKLFMYEKTTKPWAEPFAVQLYAASVPRCKYCSIVAPVNVVRVTRSVKWKARPMAMVFFPSSSHHIYLMVSVCCRISPSEICADNCVQTKVKTCLKLISAEGCFDCTMGPTQCSVCM